MSTARAPLPTIDPVVVNAVLIAVRQAANVLCDRWTLLTLLLAHGGVTRFADFRERGGMASRALGSRLAMLEEQEVMVRLAYTRRPLRHSYHLSHMGWALFDVFATMQAWEQRWHARKAGTGLVIEHSACGQRVQLPLAPCAGCGEHATPRDVDLRIHQKGIESMPERASAYRRSTPAVARGEAARAWPLPHCMAIFGDKWSIEVVMCAFVSVTSFGEMQAHTGMSTNILADRLARLVAGGVLKPTAAEGPRKGGYKLSEQGMDLFTILVCIEAWADAWLCERYRSPLRLTHRSCGHLLRPELRCEHCRQPLQRAACQMRIDA